MSCCFCAWRFVSTCTSCACCFAYWSCFSWSSFSASICSNSSLCFCWCFVTSSAHFFFHLTAVAFNLSTFVTKLIGCLVVLPAFSPEPLTSLCDKSSSPSSSSESENEFMCSSAARCCSMIAFKIVSTWLGDMGDAAACSLALACDVLINVSTMWSYVVALCTIVCICVAMVPPLLSALGEEEDNEPPPPLSLDVEEDEPEGNDSEDEPPLLVPLNIAFMDDNSDWFWINSFLISSDSFFNLLFSDCNKLLSSFKLLCLDSNSLYFLVWTTFLPPPPPPPPPSWMILLAWLSCLCNLLFCCININICGDKPSRYTSAWLLIFFARSANRNESNVSAMFEKAGPMLQIIRVTLFPPKLSCNNRVKVESRYGTCALCLLLFPLLLLLSWPSVNALTTLPKADKLLLIALPSFRRSPVAPVLDWRSDPAKSIKDNLDLMVPIPAPVSSWSIHNVNTAWDLELASFMLVFAFVLLLNPRSINFEMSAWLVTVLISAPLNSMVLVFVFCRSLIWSLLPCEWLLLWWLGDVEEEEEEEPFNKSRNFSWYTST